MPGKPLPIEEIREAVKAFEDNDRNVSEAARAIGKDRGWMQYRLRRANEVLPPEERPGNSQGVGGTKRMEFTLQDAAVFWAAYGAHGFSTHNMAVALKVSRNALDYRVRLCREQYGYEVTAADKASKGTPDHRTLQDEVALERAKMNEQHAKRRLKDASREIARLEEELRDFRYAGHSSATPAQWTHKTRGKSKGKSEHMPYLLTSDFQLGEVIRPEETDHAHGYNTELFRRRYRHLIKTTIYLSFDHAGRDWCYPGIIYARGGDTISGGIHDELRETDDLTPMEAVEIAFEEEAAGIKELLKAFGRVDVKDCGGGNHDRSTHKPQSKKANAHSYDRLISYMLRREFQSEPNVTFQITQSPDVYFPIYNRHILLTHGDKIGSRGGQGFIGPAATIMRGAQKVIQEQAALGRQVDEVHMGHFHTPFWYDWVVCNGCLPGYSEFAKMNRMRPSAPQQFLMYYHEHRGLVDLKPIMLVDVPEI